MPSAAFPDVEKIVGVDLEACKGCRKKKPHTHEKKNFKLFDSSYTPLSLSAAPAVHDTGSSPELSDKYHNNTCSGFSSARTSAWTERPREGLEACGDDWRMHETSPKLKLCSSFVSSSPDFSGRA